MERRDFLKMAALTGAAVTGAGLLSACSTSETEDAASIEWDMEADVVIVGGGGTGLAAAAEAVDHGVTVLVLEKATTFGGTTAMSGGVVQAAGTAEQKQFSEYQSDTPENHANYYLAAGEGLVEEDLIKDFTAGAPEHIRWMEEKGITFNAIYGNCHVPHIPMDVLTDRIHVPDGPNGGAAGGGAILTNAFLSNAEAGGAVFESGVEVTRLITDGENGVIGVEADRSGEMLMVKANKGVILGAGGIDHNVELAKAICPQQYWDLTEHQQCIVAPTNTGDGITMGMSLNAALSAVGGTIDFCGRTGIGTASNGVQVPCLFINGAGRRFVCEDSTYAYHFRAIFQQEKQLGAPTHMLMDQTVVGMEGSPWSADMAAEVADGTLIEAASLEEMAEKLGVPAQNLIDAVDQWNRDIAEFGEDRQYGRNTWLEPLNRAPYYAYQNKSMNLGSCGGLKINTDAQVVDMGGNVIPRLYAGGLNAGGWIGPYYPGSGTAVMGTIHWGRKAAAHAAGLDSIA